MANGTWGVDANGLWNATGSWAGGVIAVGSGDTANFTNNISANRTVTNTIGGTWTGTIGNMVFSDGGALGSSWIVSGASTITLASTGGTSSLTTTTPATISGVMTGSVDVYKYGASSLTLSGANTNLAANKIVYIQEGTLITSNANAFSSTATFAVASGATLNPTVALNRTGTIAGTGASGTGAITNANLFTGTATLSANTTLGVAASTAPDGTYNLNGYALTMTVYNNAAVTHVISGSGTQVVFNVVFATNASYDGTSQSYTVSDKVIVAGNTGTIRAYGLGPRNLGNSSNSVLVKDYGAIWVSQATPSADSVFSHDMTMQDGILIASSPVGTAKSLTAYGDISIPSGYNMYVAGYTAADDDVNIHGVISGGGNLVAGFLGGSYVQASAHIINTSNTFTGTVEVRTGNILYVYGDNSLGNPGTPTNVIMSGGSLLPSGTVVLPATRPLYATANMAFAIPSPDSLTVLGNISQDATARTLTKSSTGILDLRGTNTFSGAITHSGGTLSLGSAGAIGGGGAYTMSAAATLDNMSAGAVSLSSNNSVALNGNPTFTGSSNLTFGTGSVTMNAARTFTINGTAPSSGSSGSTLRFNGNITSTGSTLNITKSGVGRLTMAGSNAITATSHTVSAGAYQIRNADGLGASATLVTWYVSSGAALEIGGGITTNANKQIVPIGSGQSSNGAIFFVDGVNTLDTPIYYDGAFTIGADASVISNVTSSINSNTGSAAGLTSRPLNGAKITYSGGMGISTFQQTGSATGTTVINSTVTNTSTVTVSAGVLEIGTSGSFSSSTGTASVGANATLRIKRATGAILGAATTLSVAANGNLQAGTADGKLTHAGNLTLGTVSSADKAVIKFGTT